MARKRKPRDNDQKAAPDLTPMIDVTFQLLIFFILCTRFKVDERNHRVDLPLDEGLSQDESKPKPQVTIYSAWDVGQAQNHYVVAIEARNRKPVPDSHAKLADLVIFSTDGPGASLSKKQRYRALVKQLIAFTEQYIIDSGAKIEKIELAYAIDNVQGARSGTSPWIFTSLAIDACSKINQNRVRDGKKELSVTFKFSDALQQYKAHGS